MALENQPALKFGEEVKVPQILSHFKIEGEIEQQIFKDRHFFDNPSAVRMLFGLVTTANRNAMDEAAAVYMSISNSNLNVFLNCDLPSVRKTLKTPVAKDMLEIGASNAIMNLLIPYKFELTFQELLGIIFSLSTSSLHNMEALDLVSKNGLVRLTTDPELID